jgi:hypothetical protein
MILVSAISQIRRNTIWPAASANSRQAWPRVRQGQRWDGLRAAAGHASFRGVAVPRRQRPRGQLPRGQRPRPLADAQQRHRPEQRPQRQVGMPIPATAPPCNFQLIIKAMHHRCLRRKRRKCLPHKRSYQVSSAGKTANF